MTVATLVAAAGPALAGNLGGGTTGVKTAHGVIYYDKANALGGYQAEKVLGDRKRCDPQHVTVNPLLYSERERITNTVPTVGSVTITRTNRKDGYVNLKFTIKGRVGQNLCLAAARGHDGSEYIIKNKQQLSGLRRTKDNKFWTGSWTDPRKIKEVVIGGERGLSYGDDSAFTDFFIAGFRKIRR